MSAPASTMTQAPVKSVGNRPCLKRMTSLLSVLSDGDQETPPASARPNQGSETGDGKTQQALTKVTGDPFEG